MADNIITTNSGAVSAEYQQAVSLHRSIMTNAQIVAEAMLEFCKSLKEMRDKKLFAELGYNSFEDYTFQAVGLKQRQAYDYIYTYEKLGTSFLQSNANLGISRLKWLATVPALDREEFAENNDLQNMTVKEVEDLAKKLNEAQEQISFLSANKTDTEDENEKLMAEIKELKSALADLPAESEGEDAESPFDQYLVERDRLLNRIAELEASLDEPVEASEEAVEKIRAEETARAEKEAAAKIKQIEKDTKEKIKAAKDKAKADADAAIKAAEEKAQQEVAQAEKRAQEIAKHQLEDGLKDIEQEKAAAVARQEEAEQKLKVAANPDTAMLNFCLQSIQEQFGKATDCLVRIALADPDTADKLRGAVGRVLDSLKDQLKLKI